MRGRGLWAVYASWLTRSSASMTAGRLQLDSWLSSPAGAQKVRNVRISQALARPSASSRLAAEVCLGLEGVPGLGGGEGEETGRSRRRVALGGMKMILDSEGTDAVMNRAARPKISFSEARSTQPGNEAQRILEWGGI